MLLDSKFHFIGLSTFLLANLAVKGNCDWELGPFYKNENKPVLIAKPDSTFNCPVQGGIQVRWEAGSVCCGSAVVNDDMIHLFYTAVEGGPWLRNLSRIGLATSFDGINFDRRPGPILYPDADEYEGYENTCGCSNARVIETEVRSYVMTYTACSRQLWNHLFVATSSNLADSWTKHGFAFKNYHNNASMFNTHTASAAIIVRQDITGKSSRLIAHKIFDKYWMYFSMFVQDEGVHFVFMASSQDLISWEPLEDENGELLAVVKPRRGMFDGIFVWPGSSAVLMQDGILLLYTGGDGFGYNPAGQILFNHAEPWVVLNRSDTPFLKPDKPFESHPKLMHTHVSGLVRFPNAEEEFDWILYYSTANFEKIGMVTSATPPTVPTQTTPSTTTARPTTTTATTTRPTTTTATTTRPTTATTTVTTQPSITTTAPTTTTPSMTTTMTTESFTPITTPSTANTLTTATNIGILVSLFHVFL